MRKTLAFGVASLLALAAAAQTIAVAAAPGPSAEAARLTGEILTGALDALFMEGCIVTSIETVSPGEGDWAERGLREAREGFVDYLLALEPSYRASPAGPPELEELGFRILRISDGKELERGRLEPGSGGLPSRGEGLELLRSLGSEAATATLRRVRESGPGGRS